MRYMIPSFDHVYCRGVAPKAGCVQLIYSKGRARTHTQQHHPVPQHSPRNFDQAPVVHKTILHSLDNTTPQWHNPLAVWVEQIHSHTINNLSTLTSTIPPGSSTWLLCQDNGGGTSKVTPSRAHPPQGPQPKALPMYDSLTKPPLKFLLYTANIKMTMSPNSRTGAMEPTQETKWALCLHSCSSVCTACRHCLQLSFMTDRKIRSQ